jgi:hypothetical protein
LNGLKAKNARASLPLRAGSIVLIKFKNNQVFAWPSLRREMVALGRQTAEEKIRPGDWRLKVALFRGFGRPAGIGEGGQSGRALATRTVADAASRSPRNMAGRCSWIHGKSSAIREARGFEGPTKLPRQEREIQGPVTLVVNYTMGVL